VRTFLAVMAIAVTLDFCGASSVLAQGQKSNYSYDGWHKVPHPSRIQFKVFHDKVVALSNLSGGCDPGLPDSFEGKIAKVNFDDRGTMVQNFVIEHDNGERDLINVDDVSDRPGMNMADMEWIGQGLQTLLRPNRYIQGSIFRCGAAGRVLVLDGIQSVSTKPIANPPNTDALVPSEGQRQSQPVGGSVPSADPGRDQTKTAVADPYSDGVRAFGREDYAAAMRSFRPLAEQGNVRAQFYLGAMYYDGKGVPQDDIEAAKWFRKAAEQGDVVSQASLGLMYSYGEGVPQNYAEAKKWYLMAAKRGDAGAQHSLGIIYKRGRGELAPEICTGR
jgi:hypothetical protein